jgi:phosphoglycolate phosphatase-like HAD superfamily hydrolase
MRLVIFDIDGTLTATMTIDEECFVRSLAEVCGFDDIDTDWSHYQHTTDSSIFHEIHEARAGRSPSAVEVSRFQQHFIDLLRQASSKSAFSPIAGAARLLASLGNSREHRVSLATGAWRDSARLKMASAGLCYDDYPAASSDDAFERESIIKLSRQRAVERYGGFDQAIYIGDGVWDARACRALGIPFVGIAEGVRAKRLMAEGAVCVFPDLSDEDSFLRSVMIAPRQNTSPA